MAYFPFFWLEVLAALALPVFCIWQEQHADYNTASSAPLLWEITWRDYLLNAQLGQSKLPNSPVRLQHLKTVSAAVTKTLIAICLFDRENTAPHVL